MKKKKGFKILTNIDIIVRNLKGNITEEKHFKNLITTVGLNTFRDFLYGSNTDGEIKYLAVGTDNTAVAVGQTTLISESERKATTSHNNATDGQHVHIVYLGPDDAVLAIEEIGWFAGASATAAADSGNMISRVLYSKNKTALESIQVTRTDTIAEA